MTWNDAKRPACVTGPLENRELMLEWCGDEQQSNCMNLGELRMPVVYRIEDGHFHLNPGDLNHSYEMKCSSMHEAKLLAEEYL